MKTFYKICICILVFCISCSKVVDTRDTTNTGNNPSGGSNPTTPGTSNPGNPSATPGSGGGSGNNPSNPSNPSNPGNPSNPSNPTNPGTGNNPGSGGGGASSGSLGNVTLTFTSTAACAPSNEVFTFICNATNVPAGSKYEWYFGDGNSSVTNINTTTNIYNDGGNFTVICKIVSSQSQILATVSLPIKAFGQSVTPNASFFYQSTNVNTTGNTFSFNSNSSLTKGTIVSYDWDFGDGTKGSGLNVNKTYNQISSEQKFTVKLTTVSSAGCMSSQSQVVTVPPGYTITGIINAQSTSPCSPSVEEFTFTGPTSGVPSNAVYSWDLGDGNTVIGNPIKYQYTFPNAYDVKLRILVNNATVASFNRSITSFGKNVTPTVIMDVKTTNGTNEFSYNSNSFVASGAITSTIWDFGDGKSGSGLFVNHTYTQDVVDKNYTVTLTVSSNAGCKTIGTKIITVPKK
jgi:PKD repeat protein